jgi:hypothetical protein
MVHWLTLFPLCMAFAMGDVNAVESCAYCPHTEQYHTAMGSSIVAA